MNQVSKSTFFLKIDITWIKINLITIDSKMDLELTLK